MAKLASVKTVQWSIPTYGVYAVWCVPLGVPVLSELDVSPAFLRLVGWLTILAATRRALVGPPSWRWTECALATTVLLMPMQHNAHVRRLTRQIVDVKRRQKFTMIKLIICASRVLKAVLVTRKDARHVLRIACGTLISQQIPFFPTKNGSAPVCNGLSWSAKNANTAEKAITSWTSNAYPARDAWYATKKAALPVGKD